MRSPCEAGHEAGVQLTLPACPLDLAFFREGQVHTKPRFDLPQGEI